MNPNRHVFLGGAGFIGYHLANSYSEDPSVPILIVDNFIRGENDKHLIQLSKKSNVTVIDKDISKQEVLSEILMKDDIVFNLTALNGTQNFYNRPTQVLIHSAITSIVAACVCAEKKVSQYIYFGSSEAYAGGVELGLTIIPTPENVIFAFPDSQNLRWSYGMSKAIGEMACTAANYEMGLQYSIIRVHNIYGPRMGLEHVIPDLITRFQSGDMRVYGQTESRAFMYVADLVRVVRHIQSEPRLSNAVINVGSDTETSILQLATEICEQLNISDSIIDEGRIRGSVERRCPDLSLIKGHMNLELTPLKSGLSETINYYKQFPPNRLPQEFPK